MDDTYRYIQARPGYVWRPALHYGLAYTFFALVTRELSRDAALTPFVFAAGFSLGGVPVVLWGLWSARERRVRRRGPPVKWTLQNIASGLATVVIVATTVLAFMFEHVSILLALLMMRMGVLIMAPLVDRLGGRSFSRRTLIAGALCLIGCCISGFTGIFTPLSGPAFLVLAGYLSAYAVRLTLMTRYTKTTERAIRGDWFIAEMAVVAIALLIVVLATFGLRLAGDDRLFSAPAAFMIASITAGAAYGYALINGTLIYLDWRENARSVTINRATSLISGVVASLLGWACLGFDLPAPREWLLAAFMVLALVVLANESRAKRLDR